jgi:ligand-binding SRPBCC domain-containing protein
VHPRRADGWDVMYVADERAVRESGHPVLVVRVGNDEDVPFRCRAHALYEVDANVSLANLDWDDFRGQIDESGVYGVEVVVASEVPQTTDPTLHAYESASNEQVTISVPPHAVWEICEDLSADVDVDVDNEPMRTISIETTIAAPAVACFDLSLSVDAHANSMAESGERAIAGVTSGVLTLGDWVTWQARHFGIPFRMTSAITEYQRPERFVDEQRRGPFQRWWHEHTFTVMSPNQTLMADRVEFRSPFGPIGLLADVSVLDRYMTGLLRQRNDWLKSTLEAQGS